MIFETAATCSTNEARLHQGQLPTTLLPAAASALKLTGW